MACPCYAVGRLQKHADDGLWGDRVPLRAFISTGLYAFGVETAVLSGEWRVLELLLRLTLGAARPGHVRPCTARRYRWGGRGRCPCRNFSLPPTPLRLVGRRYPVLHTQCAGITRVQSVGFRPSRSTRGANPEAALSAPRLPRSVVRGRGPRAAAGILGFGRRSGHGAFTGSYLPSNECSLRTTAALALAPSAPFRARTGVMRRAASLRNATWLILPVVICLSQRLSHACVSMNKFRL
ncbi:hypothetical protein RDI58_031108 [Solanum bulbocastanum]|uniref:Uncharacterized protein n=1 Tax=Solanum bulbocastanum TaxID=147425 RepID=A0AAN8ST84_SOLBU